MVMRQGHTLEELMFWHVFDRHQCLRRDLADRFGLSGATISRTVSALLEKGLVVSALSGASRPGRKPQVLEINPKLANLLGVDIDLDRVMAVVTDMSGALLGRGAVRCNAEEGLAAAVGASRKAAELALADAGVEGCDIQHLGIAHPGDLDVERGVCVSWANAPAWKSTPIREAMQEAFQMKVTLDDRCRALALAERRTSPDDGRHPSAIYVHVGMGVGMGVFVDGRLYRGATGGGGEIGHTVIDPAGPLCKCGNRGCVEAYASIGAVQRFVRESLASASSPLIGALATDSAGEIPIEGIAAAARQGDRLAQAALERAATALGLGVANAIQILNPSLVVFTDRLARLAGERLLHTAVRIVRQRCVETASRKLEIRVSPPKKDISAIGSALLAAEAEAQRIVRTRLSPAN